MQYNFDWDPRKAKINISKHRIKFEIASTVFKDPGVISIYDNEHSQYEERWITLGIASNGSLLVVNHTFECIDKNNVNIRIISSRKATRNEKKQYGNIK